MKQFAARTFNNQIHLRAKQIIVPLSVCILLAGLLAGCYDHSKDKRGRDARLNKLTGKFEILQPDGKWATPEQDVAARVAAYEAERAAQEAETNARKAQQDQIDLAQSQLLTIQAAHQSNSVPPPEPPPPVDDRFGKPLFIDLGNSVTMEFVWVTNRWNDSHGFWIGKYEVTNKEFRQFKPDHDSGSAGGHTLNQDDQPVVNVSRNQVLFFLRWLNSKAVKSLPDGYKAQLPTRGNWYDYVRSKYPWGPEWPPLYGNYADITASKASWKTSEKNQWFFDSLTNQWNHVDSYDDGFAVSCPVGLSGSNQFGIFGLSGNVAELLDDSHAHPGEDCIAGASWADYIQPCLATSYLLHNNLSCEVWNRCCIGFRVKIGKE